MIVHMAYAADHKTKVTASWAGDNRNIDLKIDTESGFSATVQLNAGDLIQLGHKVAVSQGAREYMYDTGGSSVDDNPLYAAFVADTQAAATARVACSRIIRASGDADKASLLNNNPRALAAMVSVSSKLAAQAIIALVHGGAPTAQASAKAIADMFGYRLWFVDDTHLSVNYVKMTIPHWPTLAEELRKARAALADTLAPDSKETNEKVN